MMSSEKKTETCVAFPRRLVGFFPLEADVNQQSVHSVVSVLQSNAPNPANDNLAHSAGVFKTSATADLTSTEADPAAVIE